MRHKRLTLYIFLWGMLAALVPVGLVFLLLRAPRDFFCPGTLCGTSFYDLLPMQDPFSVSFPQPLHSRRLVFDGSG